MERTIIHMEKSTSSIQGESAGPWTSGRLLSWMTSFFEAKQIDAPRHVSQMLLAHMLDCPRIELYTQLDRPASPGELAELRALTQRAGAGEPVHLLVGQAAFFMRDFWVGGCTLIPQPATETLIQRVLDWAKQAEQEDPLIADIGTGTGCIAVTLAKELPSSQILATDLNQEIIELAERNAHRHSVQSQVDFLIGAGLEPLPAWLSGRKFDVLSSNPPYIPPSEVAEMQVAVRDFIASTAWDGGIDGLAVIKELLTKSHDLIRIGGLLVVEIASVQAEAAQALVVEAGGFDNIEVLDDHEGLPRVLSAIRCERS